MTSTAWLVGSTYAIAGSTVVHLLAGLKYTLRVWQEFWPRIMANT
jgi:hypothetical protein